MIAVAVRKSPPNEEILDALMRANGGILAAEESALDWVSAEKVVRSVFKTTYDKASSWLTAFVGVSNSPIVAVRPFSGKVIDTLIPESSLSTLGWSDQNIRDLHFNVNGRLVPPGSPREHRGVFAYLIRRDALESIRMVLTIQRAKIQTARDEERAAELAAFRERHGAALDVITSVMDRIPAKSYMRSEMVVPRIFKGSGALYTELYGGDAILTLTLHARQIDALAELLRRIPAEN